MTPFVGRLLLLTTWVGVLLLPAIYGAVTELNDRNFYEYAKDKDVLLVDFYAPWCPDCKNLDPDFEAAASSLGRRRTDLAKVDCFGAGKGLCATYGVKKWPTLKNFNRGQYTGDYEGGLSSGEISGYVNTVENSASAVSDPYAAPYTPMAVATQQCVSRCKISKVPNKTPCFARCKGAKPVAGKMLPQPVINEKSCAKCRQPQIAGKFKRRKLSAKRHGKSTSNSAKRTDLLLAAMDGRHAFVLGEKMTNPFDPQVKEPVRPAQGHEEEQLNITTLAKIPGGLKEAIELNETETRDTSPEDGPQKFPKHNRPWEKQFKQSSPLIIRPMNFSAHMTEVLVNKSKSDAHKNELKLKQKLKQKYLDDRANIVGAPANEMRKMVEPESPATEKSEDDSSLHARVFEVIKNGKPSDRKSNASFSNIVTEPGNVMMTIVQNEVKRGRTLNLHEKSLKPAASKPSGDDRNAIVLLDILAPEEAAKVPYLSSDKKKKVAKHREQQPEIVIFKKSHVHTHLH